MIDHLELISENCEGIQAVSHSFVWEVESVVRFTSFRCLHLKWLLELNKYFFLFPGNVYEDLMIYNSESTAEYFPF